jgi:hypothetical protein
MSKIIHQQTQQIMCAYIKCQPCIFTRRETDDHFRDYCSQNCFEAASKKLSNPHKKSDDEAINIKKIHAHIKDSTPSGQKIKEAFANTFKDIPLFETTIISGGTRGKHYDFIIRLAGGEEKTVEYKGAKKKSVIDTGKQPWSNGVQFYNGLANNFSVGHLYARKFYNTMLDCIIAHFNIVAPKPPYDDWAKDVFISGKPKGAFQCELREKGYMGAYLDECRKQFNKKFILSAIELQQLQTEVSKRASDVLAQKDYWLQIHGDIDDPANFEVQWRGNIKFEPIAETTQIHSASGCDVNFEFKCIDRNNLKAKLRWGYGQCISNLRLDLK